MSFHDIHLFFDLDRTIWDFDRNSEVALKSIFKDSAPFFENVSFYKFHGVYKIENAKLWKAYAQGKLTKEVLRYKRFENTFNELGLNNQKVIQYFGDEYVLRSPDQTNLIEGSLKVLQELYEMGFNMHIITNGFKEVQYRKLNNCGLEKFFKVIVCSEEVGFNKPNPEIFDYALKKSGAKKTEAIMVGDDYLADIHGAITSGWQAVFFNPQKRNNYGHSFQFAQYKELIPLILRLAP